MTMNELSLLLTVARLLRAHLQDSLPTIPNRQDNGNVLDDIASLNEAMQPFNPANHKPINEAGG